MRLLMAVMLALASCVAGCCFTEKAVEPMPATSVKRQSEAPAGNTIVVDVALLERPAGDLFLTKEVWDLGNEQCIDLETKPHLEENGLRVGLIGGMLPPRLQALLKSPRSCPDPRRMHAQPDQPLSIPVGGPRPKLICQTHREGQSRQLELNDATCCLEILATLEEDESLNLRFSPRIRHGKAKAEPRVARDPEGTLRWSVEAKEPVEEFSHLVWDLRVAPDEYVLVGARRDKPDTLGGAFFHSTDERIGRLLVIRATKLSNCRVDETLTHSPPLALQATWTARGSGR